MDIIKIGDDFLSIVKTRGVVIKTQDIKEVDKLVWVFTENLGKVSCIAKGAKRGRSNFMSSTLTFCFGNFVLYKGRSMYNVTEVEVINSFQNLMFDLDDITYAMYFCELIDICLVDGEPNKALFRDLVASLFLMKNKVCELDILARAFETKVLNATGYGLGLGQCCICGNPMDTSNYVSFQYMGGVCERCEKEGGTYVSRGAYNTLDFLQRAPMEAVARIHINDDIKKELQKILCNIVGSSYHRKPKSLETLNFHNVKEE